VDKYRCECGFVSRVEVELTDHLLEMICPEDGKAADGQVHEEGPVRLACRCGFTAQAISGLDAHFLTVFTPGDRIGPGGRKHCQASNS
jgi:hypothetical protein